MADSEGNYTYVPRFSNRGNAFYYNPSYAEGVKGLVAAIRSGGAGGGGRESERDMAMGDLYRAKAQGEMFKNNAQQNLASAVEDMGHTPQSYRDNIGRVSVMAVQGGYDPKKFLVPMESFEGEDQPGMSPGETFTRSALITQGKQPNLDFAATPDRADEIRASKAAAALGQAIAVQNVRNQSPRAQGKAAKPLAIKAGDADAFMTNALQDYSGATDMHVKSISKSGEKIYDKRYVPDDVRQTLSDSGLWDKAERAGADAYRESGGDSVAAIQAARKALGLPSGAHFDPQVEDQPAGWFSDAVPGHKARFLDSEGNDVLSRLAGAVAQQPAAAPVDGAPAAAGPAGNPAAPAPADSGIVRVNSPDEAHSLPPNTRFTPDGVNFYWSKGSNAGGQ